MSAQKSEWIYHDTNETYMQDNKLLVNLKDGIVNNHYNIPLSCNLNKSGCVVDQLISMHIHGKIEKIV